MMSENGHSPERDQSPLSTRLRACEACKARKIRCDRLSPCSACKSADIPCRSARSSQEKRQRVLISGKFEKKFEDFDSQLVEIKSTLQKLVQKSGVNESHVSYDRPLPNPVGSNVTATPNQPTPSSLYIGESSFEAHSQQTSHALEQALKDSPASSMNKDTSSALNSLRSLLRPEISKGVGNFEHDLPMPSAQLALKALRLADVSMATFCLSTPMLDLHRFKETCQNIYFPVAGYTIQDFIVTCGGLYTIFSYSSAKSLSEFDIDLDQAAEAADICERNVITCVEKMSPFTEPTLNSIEALLVGAQLGISGSKPRIAWVATSLSARLCLDSGLHRYKDDPTDPEMSRKKNLFWFSYSLDRALALNFGRAPTFSDADISITYPEFPTDDLYLMVAMWLDIARVQGRMYQHLYSAEGQSRSPERKTEAVRALVGELTELRNKCKSYLLRFQGDAAMEESVLDTEMLVLTNMTVTYRHLPTHDANPLRFHDDCIFSAREALHNHTSLCKRFLGSGRTDNAFRMYIDWNLLFCPFTPFIVIVGTAILNNDINDLNLLGEVVRSLEAACPGSPGAKRLHDICNVLYKGAQSCISQTLSRTSLTPASNTTPPMQPPGNLGQSEVNQYDVMVGQSMAIDNWPAFQLDNTNDMSMLFDNYLVGNTAMMGFFEQDLPRFD